MVPGYCEPVQTRVSETIAEQYTIPDHARSLAQAGFTLIEGRGSSLTRSGALSICREAASMDPWLGSERRLQVVGEFAIPADSAQARDFQVLHFDFGLPLVARQARDLAHYTVLFLADEDHPTRALTRLVDLEQLLAQRSWPDKEELARRFAEYGESHGAWESSTGYTEGILGRLIEAADGREPALPSVGASPDFLCGTEFARADEERRFLEERGLDVGRAETRMRLRPGQILIFDNLRVAHGRLGLRKARELHQLVLGYRRLDIPGQLQARERILSAFGPSR